MNSKNTTKQLVLCALGIAFVYVATFFIVIPNGINGYFNAGDGFIYLFSSVVSPFGGLMIGGVGSALADIVGGYGIYAIPTFIIKGCMGFLTAYIFSHSKSNLKWLILIVNAMIMVGGYFIADWIINQSVGIAIGGLLANSLQGIVGVIIGYITIPIVQKITNK